MASEVPESQLESWYDEYLAEYNPADNDGEPALSYEDWVSDDYSELLARYNYYLRELSADYALD